MERSGAHIPLFNSPTKGTLENDALTPLRNIASRARQDVANRVLDYGMSTDASGGELFELVKRVHKLPYQHRTDSRDSVKQGTKRLGDLGAPGVPRPATLGEIPSFASALPKLERIVEGDASDAIHYEALAPIYLGDRR